MRVIGTEKLPIKMWLQYLEDGAEEQAKHLANLPFAFHHVAIMADSHFGYGMPIGGVLATKGVVIPNAVGVDIGCGMIAVKTNLTELDSETLKRVMGLVRKRIPVGMNRHGEAQNNDFMPGHPDVRGQKLPIVRREYDSALTQVGTLGGGNHFIEIQYGDDGHVWIMIHSGSRNIGLKVAKHYNDLAKSLNEKWHTGIAPSWDLAFLPADSEEGQLYISEMNYCVEFALANRKLMMNRVVDSFLDVLGSITTAPMINIAHNYAAIENHFGANVWVHRKGATKASQDLLGIIPGSQGAKSYIVQGKGNKESFRSCSHGAGRKLSRTKARSTLNLEEEIAKLDAAGVIHSIRNQQDLDEAAGAYKPIDEVMANQVDLVDKLVELSPLAVIKG